MTCRLMIKTGDRYRPATRSEVSEAAGELAMHLLNSERPILSSPDAAMAYLKQAYAARDYEVFGLLLLDRRHRLIEAVELFRGTIDGATVHSREVVKEVLFKSSAEVILFHNHPSGSSEPSHADETLTQRLKHVLQLLEVRVIDHLIVGAASVYSFSAHGLL